MSVSANPHRGEFELKLAGTVFKLRPSFDAIREIEEKTGRTLFALAVSASAVALTFREAGLIAATLIRAGAGEDGPLSARGADADKIGLMIFEEGVPDVQGVLAEVLKAALSGGVTASGEGKPVTETTRDSPSVTGG